MDKLEAFSEKLDSYVEIGVSTVYCSSAYDCSNAQDWTNGGWSNSYDSWVNGGWSNSYDSWINGGWNNSYDSWSNGGWNNSYDSWSNGGWNNDGGK